ncbi:MauE/DoxX family redox-associated membrane protein [Pedobacter cryotolerans]|uniref:Methylamine utilisation protein MauE domain-containing protein n=1 Tax=Pedobacter cryotolerans TaxID=2571270 RepID=A0A4U1C3W6_9SPHI|nr:MauE/DoxX family redox-associated membrane protein [Pedobacter cryotolerans]TKC00054.1 hypothetical protein FA045_11485 [Pedobacter cryotolerans]
MEKKYLSISCNNLGSKNYTVHILAALMFILMFYAGIVKLSTFQVFVIQLDKSPLIPDVLTVMTAITIPMTELLIALGLLFYKYRTLSFLAGFGIMFGFSLYLIVLNTFYVEVPCSCGGILGKMSYETHIVFNVAFTIISYTGYYFSKKQSNG